MDTKQTLATLYSLRAGLSALSIQKDELCSKENKVKSKQDALADTNVNIEQAIESSRKAQLTMTNLNREIERKPKKHYGAQRIGAIFESIGMAALFSIGGVILGAIGTIIVAFISEFFFSHVMADDGFGFLIFCCYGNSCLCVRRHCLVFYPYRANPKSRKAGYRRHG